MRLVKSFNIGFSDDIDITVAIFERYFRRFDGMSEEFREAITRTETSAKQIISDEARVDFLITCIWYDTDPMKDFVEDRRALVSFKRLLNGGQLIELYINDSVTREYWVELTPALDESGVIELFDGYLENMRREGYLEHQSGQLDYDDGEITTNQTIDFQDDSGIATADAQYVFRKKGGVWGIVYRGRGIIHIRDIKGLHFISYLLANPHREFDVLILEDTFEKHLPLDTLYAKMSDPKLDDENLRRAGSDDDTVLDDEAIGQYKKRLNELIDERKIATAMEDDETLSDIDDETENIENELNRSTGLFGRPREFSSDHEKARYNVWQRINLAKAKIRDLNSELYEHLDTSIDTGYKCVYKPSSPITWQT